MISIERNESLQDEDSIHDYDYQERPIPLPVTLENTQEWTYTMRRNMQEVIPGLYLGPYSAATKSNYQTLVDNSITHIVCVRQDIEAYFIKPNFPDKFKYMTLNIADSTTENIIQHFSAVKSFIDEGLKVGKVLVHGNAGISRSAALVLAYVMEKYVLTQSEAYSLVQNRRFCINPNEGFMAQLREFEPIYRAQRILKNDQSSTKERSKRSIHEMSLEHTDDRNVEMDS